jgi:hypothetical protein
MEGSLTEEGKATRHNPELGIMEKLHILNLVSAQNPACDRRAFLADAGEGAKVT